MSKSRGNVVDPWEVIDEPRRRRLPLVLLHRPAAVGGLPLLDRGARRDRAPVLPTLWNTYSFWVLYANAEGLERVAELGDLPPERRTTWTGGRSRGSRRLIADGDRADGRLRLHDGRAGDRRLRRRALELVRAALAPALLGRATAAAFATLRHCLLEVAEAARPVHPVPRRRDLRATSPAASGRFGDRTRSTCRLPEPDDALARRASWRPAWRPCAAPSSWAGPPAPRRSVKVRQPLRKAVIVASGRRARGDRGDGASWSRAELNVKELEFVSEEAELVRYAGEAQLPRRSARGSASRCRRRPPPIEALDPGHVAEAIAGERRIGINVDGTEHELEPDDVTLVMQPLEGYQVEAEAGRAVALALELDDELRREGLAREIVHAVQNARKEAGLEVTDRISLALGGDAELVEAARAHEEYVAGETLATSVGYDGAEAGGRGHDRGPRAADRRRARRLSRRRRGRSRPRLEVAARRVEVRAAWRGRRSTVVRVRAARTSTARFEPSAIRRCSASCAGCRSTSSSL